MISVNGEVVSPQSLSVEPVVDLIKTIVDTNIVQGISCNSYTKDKIILLCTDGVPYEVPITMHEQIINPYIEIWKQEKANQLVEQNIKDTPATIPN